MRPITILCLLMTLTVTLVSSSCSKLPKGWPLASFKPPKGAVVRAIPRKVMNVRERLVMLPEPPDVAQRPDWEVAFDYAEGWDAMVADADTKLKALGYVEWQPQRPEDNDKTIAALVGIDSLKNAARVYTAPDKAYTVVLLNAQSAVSQENAIEAEGEFVYQIAKGAK